MNDSQRKAVQSSFDIPLTVITGPPGTGKSQVVMNIIANAAANGHSLVFASKNNKAIDCVKERLDEMMDENYLLRFGSKENISQQSKPALTNFISRSEQGGFRDVTEALAKEKQTLTVSNDRVRFLEKEISRIEDVRLDIGKAEVVLNKAFEAKDKWLQSIPPLFLDVFVEKKLKVKGDVNQFNLLITELDSLNSNFLSRLYFTLFKKSTIIQSLKSINDEQPEKLCAIVSEHHTWAQPNKSLLLSGREHLAYWVELRKEEEAITRKMEELERDISQKIDVVEKLTEELQWLELSVDDYTKEIDALKSQRKDEGVKYLNMAVNKRLRDIDRFHVRRYLDYIPASNIWRDEEVKDYVTSTTGFLKNFCVVCMTNLSVKNSLPLEQGMVDVLVIDEASQCDVASALPLIYRAKRVVVIGDPLQLRHITSVQKTEQEFAIEVLQLESTRPNYVEQSLYDYAYGIANQSNFSSVFLDEHYRCHPEIISFSNRAFYERELGQSMKIRTKGDDFIFGERGLNWINVKGEMDKKRNENLLEVSRCVSLVKSLLAENQDATIGVITPFNHQKKLLQKACGDVFSERVIADTVHRFQGDERDIIILSLVLDDDCPEKKFNFLNANAYLLNVAITRARSALYIVGNHSACKKRKVSGRPMPLAMLAEYAEDLGRVSK